MKTNFRHSEIFIFVAMVLILGGVVYGIIASGVVSENSDEQQKSTSEDSIYLVQANNSESNPTNKPQTSNPVIDLTGQSSNSNAQMTQVDINEGLVDSQIQPLAPSLPQYQEVPRVVQDVARTQDYLLYQEARDFFDDGYIDESILKFREFTRLYPESKYYDLAEIYLGRAMIARGQKSADRNDYSRAQDILIKALKRFLSTSYSNDQETVDSLSQFLVAVAEANRNFGIPNSSIAHHIEQLLLYAEGNTKSQLYSQLGYLRFYENNLDEAMICFQKSDSTLAQLGRARVYLKWGEEEKALSIYEQIIKYNKESNYYNEVYNTYLIQATALGKKYYQQKEYRNAIRVLSLVIELDVNSKYAEEAYYFSGMAYFFAEDYLNAIKLFNLGMNNTVSTRDNSNLFYKARALYQRGDLIRSLNIFNHLIDYYPQSPHINESKKWKEFISRELEAKESIESANAMNRATNTATENPLVP